MDEDASRSLVSQPAPDTSSTTSSGQARPLSSRSHNSTTTLPLRGTYSESANWITSPPFLPRVPQRTLSLSGASEISTSSDSSSASSSRTDMATTSSVVCSLKEDPKPAPKVTRKDDEGECSICWEPFEKEKNELVWCQLTCGNNFHKKCFVEWLLIPKHQRSTGDLTCPFCRGKWDPIELRTLQLDNGITPARPPKRLRTDIPSPRAPFRNEMRRMYRERQRARENYAPLPRFGGDSYRPQYGPRMTATPGGHTWTSASSAVPGSFYTSTPPSMRSTGAPPSTPQTSNMPPQSRPYYPPMSDYVPMPFIPSGPTWNHQSMPNVDSNSFHNHNAFPIQPSQPYSMTPMSQMPAPLPSHDLTSQGYNLPTFSQNPYLPPMVLPSQQRSVPGPSQRPMSRCPAMQAQAQRMSSMSPTSPPPQFASTTGPMPVNPYVCPGMMMPGMDVQVNYNLQYSYHFAGPSVP